MTTAALFFLLLLFMISGIPVAISLGLSSTLIILFFSSDSLGSVALKIFENVSEHYTLLAIPFFILSSSFLSTGGVAQRMIRFTTALVGHIRGGLAMASVLACMLFAAVSGSSPATVAAIGSICIAGMVQAGYSKQLGTGVICNAGTLGILIPPSIPMLVYAAATEVSAARMFMAGVIPGLMIGFMLMVGIYFVARYKNIPALPFPGIGELASSFWSAFAGLLLIVLVLGAIYGGIASPTEAAAASAVYAYLVAVFGYRDIGPLAKQKWRNKGESIVAMVLRNTRLVVTGLGKSVVDPQVNKTIMDAAKVSLMLLFIIANAMLFAHVLTTERIPHLITESIISMGLTAWGFLIVVNILLLIAGNFMDPVAVLLILAPILFPVSQELGIDPIHLGIIMVVNMEIGMLTPPVGLNLFVASGITGENLLWATKAALPWLGVLLIGLIIVTYFPSVSLALPEYIDHLRGY